MTMLTRTALFVFALALPGCLWIPKADTGEPSEAIDADGDGYSTLEDCDDGDAAVHPGADETCNGVDDDCDDEVDEDDAVDATTWYADEDGDGYGAPDTTQTSCAQPSGFVDDDTDCDDSDATINPETLWYPDSDGDGFGDEEDDGTEQCEQPTDHVLDATDCDDSAEDVNPDEEEQCDEVDHDCDGENGLTDDDSDGWAVCENDCDDSDAAVNPGATEVCDEIDNDCDGDIDEADAQDAATWYLDADSDSYGTAEVTVTACNQPTGYVDDSTDCDDGDSAVNPAATEVCDEIDNDCDGDTDDDDTSLDTSTASTWYTDGDGDGYGDSASTSLACDQPSGTVSDSTDCDDGDSAVNPAATEVCDEIDNDCDGDTDGDDASLDTTTASTWYTDGDGDGYGDSASTSLACDQPSGSVSDDTDCDDGDASAYPGADEYCDGTDNDCDGDTDEDEAVDATTWYADTDSDGYGDVTSSYVACYAPSNHVSDATDCDDSDSAINPAASEICNGIDDDCDGDVDDDDGSLDMSTVSTWYADTDSDGYGDSTSSSLSCDAPSGAIVDGTDCDDGDSAVNPAATEICDGIDNDCDGYIDDDDGGLDISTAGIWYADSDGDGYGDGSGSTLACEAPSGTVADATDCDDSDSAVNPAGTEICNGIDDDCDADVDDDDGSLDTSTASTWYADVDSDGYGDSTSSSLACDAPSGSISDATDCDDSDASINPSATEVYENGVDEDCDGYASIFWDDFDDETDGDPASGDDGWIGSYGSATWATGIAAYYSSDHAYSGSLSLSTAGGSGEAGRYHSAFGSDFGMSFQLYDEGNSNPGATPPAGSGDLIVGFGSTSTSSGLYGAFDVWVGWYAYWSSGGGWSAYNCDDDYYCSADAEGHVCNLAPRSVGWHEFELEFRYTASGEGHFVACVDGTCSDEVEDCATFSGRFDESLDFFGVNDDAFVGYFDDVHAWDLDDAPHLVLAEANVDAMLVGPNANERVGMSLDSLGDIDGDGYGDLIVGGSYDGGSDGTAYVMYGPVSGYVDLAGADAILEGTGRSSQFISSVGDVDGDGAGDVLIGAYTGGGVNYLVSGPFSGTIDITTDYTARLEGPSDWAITSSGPGDLDNDGYGDFIITGPNSSTGGSYSGTAYLVLGPATGSISLSSGSDASFYGASGDQLNASSGVGDVDGDGFVDVIISGAGTSNPTGTSYLLLGPTSFTGSVDITSAAAATYLADGSDYMPGGSLSGGGDVDGDGYPDWLIGSMGEDGAGTDAGAVYLVLGTVSPSGTIDLSSAEAKLYGEGEEFEIGVSVSLDGDTNGDGLADILVGSSEDTSTGPGRAYLFVNAPSGSVNVSTADLILSGESNGDLAGEMVKIIADTDGDGLDDILIGAPYMDWGASNAGGAYLLLGTEL
jgi:hypothetical protein